MVLNKDYSENTKEGLDELHKHYIIEDESVEMTEELIEKVLNRDRSCCEKFIICVIIEGS